MNFVDSVILSKYSKQKDSVILLKAEDLFDFQNFYLFLSKNIILGNRYTILVRVCYESYGINSIEFTEYKMLGSQLGIHASDEKGLMDRLQTLYTVLTIRLKNSMDVYSYGDLEIINFQVIIFSLGEKVVIKSNKFKSSDLGEEKSLVNVSRVKDSYKFTDTDQEVLLNKSVKFNSVNYIYNKDKPSDRIYLDKFINKYGASIICNPDNDYMLQETETSTVLHIILKREGHKTYYIFTLDGTFVEKIVYKYLSNKSYTRSIGNVTTFVNDTGVYCTNINLRLPPIVNVSSKGRKKTMLSPDWKIGSMDLETYKSDGFYNGAPISKTYAIGFYTKDSLNTFYIDEFLNSDTLILKCLNAMLTGKYNGYTFYVHNLTKFDINFLFRILISSSNGFTCIPYFRDDKIIGVKLSKKVNNKVITIRIIDSVNMLKDSLHNLCKSFNTEIKKSLFPYSFVNTNTLFYKGVKPDMKYYTQDANVKVSLEDYNEIKSYDWDLKEETIKYLGNDLISLYSVMEAFIKRVYIEYNVQVTDSLTISSLSMNIFLKKFYGGQNIPLIKDKTIFKSIKHSYYGGVTEVYKPYGENLYYYDVNSLYPYAALNDMPGRDCVYSSAINKNISEINLDDFFGFFYCKIKTSDNYIGLLPHRSNEGLTMPLGEFEGWYFSEELKFAYENGYKIEVVRGYYFNRVVGVFSEYVHSLYLIKSTTKDAVEKQMVKSLLNNLIGRFGLDINKYVTSIVSSDVFKDLAQTRKIRGVKFVADSILLSYEKQINKDICEEHSIDFKEAVTNSLSNNIDILEEVSNLNVSIAIPSSVTAYSRIYMNKVKLDILKRGGLIYYTDTDSIVTNIELPEHLVGKGLGLFKLEHYVKEGYFVSNKTYGIKTDKETIIKNKGVLKGQLSYDQLKSLYLGDTVKTVRHETKKSLSVGSATLFVPRPIDLSPNAYDKRTKIYKDNLWVDTKPLVKHYHSSVSNNSDKVLSIKRFRWWLLGLSMSLVGILYAYNFMLYDVVNSYLNTIEPVSDIHYDNVPEKAQNTVTSLRNYLDSNFLDKFRGEISYNIKYPDITTSKVTTTTHDDDKVRVLNSVLKYHIDILVKENIELRQKNSILEIVCQRYRINRLERLDIIDDVIKQINGYLK